MLFRIMYAILWPIMHIIFPYRVVGTENLCHDTDGYVVCCNHISLLDPVYLIYILKSCRKRRIYFMAKSEIFKNPIANWFFRGVGAFPVSRGTGGAEGIRSAEEHLENGDVLGIFPEGTRSIDGHVHRGKAGAAMLIARYKTKVQPVAIVAKNQKVRPFRKVTITICKPFELPECPEGESPKNHLRTCTEQIMRPIVAIADPGEDGQ